MKILMYGDSITDAIRLREEAIGSVYSYGNGYVKFISGDLALKDPHGYEIINRGISGNRIVDLYARVKADVWNHNPDVLSILIGVNDIWHELSYENGVDVVRFERMYRMLLDDTLARLSDIKLILCEPFVLKGSATEEKFDRFLETYDYAKAVKRIAEDYGAYFLPLQAVLSEAAEKYGAETVLSDGVHPATLGAKIIADEWLKLFFEKVDK